MHNLFFSGRGKDIYFSILQSAEECLSKLKDAEYEQIIHSKKAEHIRATVEEELEEVSKIRYSLSTVDNKIDRERQSNPRLKEFICLQGETSDTTPLDLLIDKLLSLDPMNIQPDLAVSADRLRPEIAHSLRLRIQCVWSWDEILDENCKLLSSIALHTGHLLMEVAKELDDEEIMQQVCNLLANLKLKCPQESMVFSLPSSPAALKKILSDGVHSLENLQNHINQIDIQRAELKDTSCELETELEKIETDASNDSFTGKKEVSTDKTSQQRMAFLTRRR